MRGRVGALAMALILAAPGAILAPPVLAQPADACTTETEPNDQPDGLPFVTGPLCIEGELPPSDQDLTLWELTPEEARRPWTITVSGVPGTVTGLKIVPIAGEPGASPIVPGNQLLEVGTTPADRAPAVTQNVLLPAGRFILGISRSGLADGSEPTRTGYRFSVVPGDPLPAAVEAEPNDGGDTATQVAGAFDVSGDAAASTDVYAWNVPESAQGTAWSIAFDAPIGGYLALALRRADGTEVAAVSQDRGGHGRLVDQVLAPGRWDLVVTGAGEDPTPYRLSATQTPLGGDAEPNDRLGLEVPADPASAPVRGRLWPADDTDRYRISVPDDGHPVLRDLKLLGGPGLRRSLCLQTETGSDLQCRDGTGGVALRSLALPPGEYLVRIGGEADADRPYVLRLDETATAVPDFETEPNDEPSVATPWDPGLVMRALGAELDTDLFRLEVTGAPQLWEITARGTGLTRLSWTRADWSTLADGGITPERDVAVLTDLYLVPGAQLFRVEGAGDYTLTATPLGPPDPNAEREPNNSAGFAEPYRLGRSDLIGRLPSTSDADVFRFTLAGQERVTLLAQPPEDGGVGIRVEAQGESISRLGAPGPGLPTRLELLLEPGDYEVWLLPDVPSQGRYHFSIERGDPFRVRADDEPNDRLEAARPMPPTLIATGSFDDSESEDWYALPAIDPAIPLLLQTSGEVWSLRLTDGTTDVPVTWDGSTGVATTDGLSGIVPRYLVVSGVGGYGVAMRGPGLQPASRPAAVPVTASLVPEADAVAAYWPAGQRLGATLSLRNDGEVPVDLQLDAFTSHFAWAATPASTAVHLEPGAAQDVPVDIRVGPDAWRDEPVRVTLRGGTTDGGWVSAATMITPRGDIDPVAPEQAWSVPDALLGGLDVASQALGATTVPAYDPTLEDQLHDGFSHTGMGFSASGDQLPITLTVDLAGDAPVPVAGFALNPQGRYGLAGAVPRDVELLLSTDGVTFTPAMSVHLSTLMADQFFVLPSPVPATHAQLRIDSVRGNGFGEVVLGEWKVIATPGSAPTDQPIDLAQPVRGGHVAWMEPQAAEESTGSAWLDEAPDFRQLYVEAGTPVSWAVGFQDDRAAQITRLEWVDPLPSTEGQRFKEVTVEGSMEGAAGPWTPIGTWKLTRADDGTVAPYDLPEPTWARFLRFTGQGPRKKDSYWDPPSTMRVLERPTDAGYRSVLGQWGAGEPVGPAEWITPPDLSLPAVPADQGNTAETAVPFGADGSVTGRIEPRTDEDWYTFTVPDGQNTMEITVAGKPLVAVALRLVDAEGLEVPVLFGAGDRPGTVRYTAEVEPGATYRVQVVQPPSSIVFTFDTSMSMGPYLDFVYQAMRAFTADVTKGEEFVSIIPFEEDPLLEEFSDDPFALQSAVWRYFAAGGSSSAETALQKATTELSARQGAKAVLMVTDAETSSFAKQAELWQTLSAVRPLVFAVHVGATSAPPVSTAYMQDWAGVADGFYQYTRSHGEMDRAFDRLATWLRRPANYRLSLVTSFQEKPPESAKPGSIAVTSPADGSATISPDVGLEIILDTSGSMLKQIKGKRRIDLAKDVLADIVTNRLPSGAPVAVRVLGDAGDVCGTRLVVPLGPLDPASVIAKVRAIDVVQETDTPLGQALRAVPDDLAGSTGTRIVLLITDSEEVWPNPDLCGSDPAAAVRDLRRRGVDARLNIVGLQVDSKKATKQLRSWARTGNGSYFTAKDAASLGRSIRTAVSPPFRVLDANGNEVASGTVDGTAVAVKPGTYSVVVLTDPVARFDGVEIKPGDGVSLQLPDAPPPPSLEPLPSAGP